MRVEIEIDETLIPEGYEAIAVRVPKAGDVYSHQYEIRKAITADGTESRARMIIRKVWKWPEWLTCDWIAKDEDGDWYGYNISKPEIQPIGFTSEDEAVCLSAAISGELFPPCAWKDSLRENPNRKASNDKSE